jgi:hypothetical protein
MRTAIPLLAAACFLLPAWPLQAHAQASDPPSAQATRLFAQAQAAFAKGDKMGAYEAYKAAWALQRSYDIAGNLGGLELKLGKHRDAAEHLAFALEDFPPTGEPAQRKAVEKKLAEAAQEVARLHVQVSANGATVTVNGATVGTSPITRTLYVDAGAIVVEASLPGYVSAGQTVTVAKGAEANVSLTVVPERGKPSLALVISGSAVALVGIGVGVGLVGAAAQKAGNADSLAAQGKSAGLTCANPPPAGKCTDIHNANATSDALHNAGVPVLVVGAAAAAATLTYALWPRGGPARKTGVTLLPAVGANGGGLWVSGRFW